MSAVIYSSVPESSKRPVDGSTLGPIPKSPSSTPAHASIDDLDRQICRLVRQMNAESFRMLVLVREFDDRFGWGKWLCASCAEWLAWRCGISLSAAREKVRAAQALRHLPAISAAFADGRLSYTKVRALTRVAHGAQEDLLLAYALEATAAQVEERCRQIRNSAPESVQVARRAWERRSLGLWRDAARGTLRITVELPIEDGELVARALDCAVAAGEVTMGIEPPMGGGHAMEVEPGASPEAKGTTWRAQQADALVAVARAYLDGGGAASDASSSADRYQVVVHVDERALRTGVGRADLPLATIRRLTCDCSLVTVVESADGTPLDVGRKHRTPSTALKRALYARDRGCTFPGCERRHYVDAHHLKHWANAGETTPDNLTLLCTHHHRLLHEGGFHVVREPDGLLRFTRADGRVVPRCGYRVEDFMDDDVGVRVGCAAEMATAGSDGEARDVGNDGGRNLDLRPSREGSCTKTVRNPSAEVREPEGAYVVMVVMPASSGDIGRARPAGESGRNLYPG